MTIVTRSLAEDIEQGLAELPMFDVHTHLVGGRLGARGLHDILLYHMVVSDLYAAGCPSGARLTQYPGWPTQEEAHARLEEAIPFLPLIENTSCYWCVRMILRDLYDWRKPVTRDNWRELDAVVREHADDRDRHRKILDRLNIRRTGTEWARRGAGEDDDRLQYALEWGFFTRCQWGEFDTALYELERCWGRTPESPAPIGGGSRPATERTIRTLDDVHDAIAVDSQRSESRLGEAFPSHRLDGVPPDLGQIHKSVLSSGGSTRRAGRGHLLEGIQNLLLRNAHSRIS